MWPLIKVTVRQRLVSIISWSVGLAAFVWLELGVYSSVNSQAQQLNHVFNKLPGTFRSLFGAQDVFSPAGWMNSHLYYLLVPLMFSCISIGLGSSLIAREESDGTLELLLSRPISRGKLIASKAFAGLVIFGIIAAVTAASSALIVKGIHYPMAVRRVAFATLLSALLALLLGAIAFCTTAFGRWGRGASMALAALIGLGGYIVGSLEGSVHWLTWPAKFFPYHYYNTSGVLYGYYSYMVAGVFAAVALVLIIISWLAFRRRDLTGS